MHQSVEYAQYKAQRIKELIPELNRQGVTILDIGCADGTMTFYLQELFFESKVVGVDQDLEKLAQAQKKFPAITFQTTDTVLKKSWDAIIIADVLHHVPCKERANVVQQFMSLVKPGGFCIVLEINPWHYASRHEFYNNPEEKNAQMLSPFQAWRLVRRYGSFSFYSFSLPWPLHGVETFLCKVPLGSLYVFRIKKGAD